MQQQQARLEKALFQLGKELTCSVCLSIMHPPCARLSCAHYFCRDCAHTALRQCARCPVCKLPAGRRDVATDPAVSGLALLYGALEQGLGRNLLCTQLPAGDLDPEALLEALAPMPRRRRPVAPAPAASARTTTTNNNGTSAAAAAVAPASLPTTTTTTDEPRGAGGNKNNNKRKSVSFAAPEKEKEKEPEKQQPPPPPPPPPAARKPPSQPRRRSPPAATTDCAAAAALRRVPARHVPWSCGACTLENPGAARECSVCGTPRGSAKPPGEALAATRRALAATARQHGRQQQQQHHHAPARQGLRSRPRSRSRSPPQPDGAGGDENAVPQQPADKAATKKPATTSRKRASISPPRPAEPEEQHQEQHQQQPASSSSPSPPLADAKKRPRNAAAPSSPQPPPPPRLPPSAWVLAGSGLVAEQRKRLKEAARRLGAKVAGEVAPGVTHVVVAAAAAAATNDPSSSSSPSSRRARRTLKYLMGLLCGAWVVGEDWLDELEQMVAAVAEGGNDNDNANTITNLPDERAFLAEGDTSAGLTRAPLRAREAAEAWLVGAAAEAGDAPPSLASYPCSLLRGRRLHLWGPLARQNGVAALARATGAEVVETLPPESDGPQTLVVVDPEDEGAGDGGDGDSGGVAAAQKAAAAAPNAQVVGIKWLYDCVSAFRPLPLEYGARDLLASSAEEEEEEEERRRV